MTSNNIKIEVFETVKLIPGDILMYPGGRWTIDVSGGPTGSAGSLPQVFSVVDTKIASIDKYGEVLGKLVGDTEIVLKLYHTVNNVQQELASIGAKIRVRLITGIEIPLMHRRSLFTESMTRVNSRLRFENEFFVHAIGATSYSWKSSSPHHYSLNLPSKSERRGSITNSTLTLKK